MSTGKLRKLRSPDAQAERTKIRLPIAARLVEARFAVGFRTASDAARELEIAGPTYMAHENGSRSIRPDMMRLYAEEFRVSQAWLLTGKEGATSLPVPIESGPDDACGQITKICLRAALEMDSDDAAQLLSLLVPLLQLLKKAS